MKVKSESEVRSVVSNPQYKKELHDPDNHDGVISHLEPDILECKVKWAFGSNTMSKNSGGDGILAEPFQILTDDVVKVLHSVCQQIWKTHQWPRTGKDQFSFQSQRRAMSKNVQPPAQLHSFHMLARKSQNLSSLGFKEYMNQEFSDVQAGFRKGGGTRDQLPTSVGS